MPAGPAQGAAGDAPTGEGAAPAAARAGASGLAARRGQPPLCLGVGPRRWLGSLAGPGGGDDGGGSTGSGGVLVGAHGGGAGWYAECDDSQGDDAAPDAGYSHDGQCGAAGDYIDDCFDAQEPLKDLDAGFVFYHHGSAAVGLDGWRTVAGADGKAAA